MAHKNDSQQVFDACGRVWLMLPILLLVTGCFQNRYETAEWRSKYDETPMTANLNGTSLPGTSLPGTSLPSLRGGTTLPGTSLPFQARGLGNTTLPAN